MRIAHGNYNFRCRIVSFDVKIIFLTAIIFICCVEHIQNKKFEKMSFTAKVIVARSAAQKNSENYSNPNNYLSKKFPLSHWSRIHFIWIFYDKIYIKIKLAHFTWANYNLRCIPKTKSEKDAFFLANWFYFLIALNRDRKKWVKIGFFFLCWLKCVRMRKKFSACGKNLKKCAFDRKLLN